MTLNDIVDTSNLLQSVNVLGVVPQELPMFFYGSDEPVARRRLELTRVNLPGEFEEGPRIFPEVVDVEHSLGEKRSILQRISPLQ